MPASKKSSDSNPGGKLRQRAENAALIWTIPAQGNGNSFVIIGAPRPELVGRHHEAGVLYPNGPLHDSRFAMIMFPIGPSLENVRAEVRVPQTGKLDGRKQKAEGPAQLEYERRMENCIEETISGGAAQWAGASGLPPSVANYFNGRDSVRIEGGRSLVAACRLGIMAGEALQCGTEEEFCRRLLNIRRRLQAAKTLASETARVIEIIEEIAPRIFVESRSAPTKKAVRTAFNDRHRAKARADQMLSSARLSTILASVGLEWLPTEERRR